jgi:signal transduction histidine kinase
MRSSALVVLGAGLLAGFVVGVVHGAEAGLVTAVLVAAVSGLGLTLAHASVARLARPPLHRRFAVIAALAAGIILVSVFVAAEMMFVSDHDALIVSAMALAAGLVALRASLVATRTVTEDVESIRDRLREVGAGERSRRAEAGSAAELVELADAANTMIRQLTEEEMRRDAADRARRDLVAAVSHDLRTPMAALRVMVDAIDEGLADEKTRERYLATMRTHLAALGAMTDELFELSRIEAGDLQWSIGQVELGELVDETVAAMRIEAEAKGVSVSARLAPLPRPPRGDPEKLQRVLFNLIRNAIRHTPPDGSVTVRAEPAGEWVEVEVADTGPGVPAEHRQRIFDPFVRGEEARSSEGAGLGLAISRAIVEAHSGRIWVAEDGPGTRVKFVIPT